MIPKEPGLNQKVFRKAKSDIGKNRVIDAVVKCSVRKQKGVLK